MRRSRSISNCALLQNFSIISCWGQICASRFRLLCNVFSTDVLPPVHPSSKLSKRTCAVVIKAPDLSISPSKCSGCAISTIILRSTTQARPSSSGASYSQSLFSTRRQKKRPCRTPKHRRCLSSQLPAF
jgi:hypothetical protein